jgi:hypothetical protein
VFTRLGAHDRIMAGKTRSLIKLLLIFLSSIDLLSAMQLPSSGKATGCIDNVTALC